MMRKLHVLIFVLCLQLAYAQENNKILQNISSFKAKVKKEIMVECNISQENLKLYDIIIIPRLLYPFSQTIPTNTNISFEDLELDTQVAEIYIFKNGTIISKFRRYGDNSFSELLSLKNIQESTVFKLCHKYRNDIENLYFFSFARSINRASLLIYVQKDEFVYYYNLTISQKSM